MPFCAPKRAFWAIFEQKSLLRPLPWVSEPLKFAFAKPKSLEKPYWLVRKALKFAFWSEKLSLSRLKKHENVLLPQVRPGLFSLDGRKLRFRA